MALVAFLPGPGGHPAFWRPVGAERRPPAPDPGVRGGRRSRGARGGAAGSPSRDRRAVDGRSRARTADLLLV